MRHRAAASRPNHDVLSEVALLFRACLCMCGVFALLVEVFRAGARVGSVTWRVLASERKQSECTS